MSNEFQNASEVQRATLMYEVLRLFGHCSYLYSTLRQIETAGQARLSLNDVKALDLIRELGSLTIGQLTQLTGLSAGGTTAVVDRLERAELITRERHHDDRRITIVRPVADNCTAFQEAKESALARMLFESGHPDSYEQEQMRTFLQGSMAALKTETSRYLLSDDNAGRR